jgi:hypothetical protein
MFHHLLPTHLVLPIIYYLDCVFQAFRYASQQKAEKNPNGPDVVAQLFLAVCQFWARVHTEY